MVTLRSVAPAVCIAAAGMLLLTGCGSTSFTSSYHEKPFTVDGDAADWVGLPLYVDKSGVNVAVSHDAEYLYVLVSATERSLQSQIRRGGFTVWFDPTGGSDKTLGVRYPLGVPGGPPPADGDEEGMMPPDGFLRSMQNGVQTDMELLGPGAKDRMIVSMVQEKQIQAKMSTASGGLTYELRVPLKRDDRHPNGIGVIEGKNVGVGLQAERRDGKMRGRPEGGRDGGRDGMMPPGGDEQQGEGSMPPGGGRRGGPGGGRGQGGGAPGGRGQESNSSPIDVWLTVVLPH
jgi:hypothetical protein